MKPLLRSVVGKVAVQEEDRMTPSRWTVLVVAAAAACSGGSTSEQSFRAAAPTTAGLSMTVDAAPTTSSTAADAAIPPAPLPMMDALSPCHPHLFARTETLAARWNRHVAKALRRIERVIAKTPGLSTDAQVQWTETRDGVETRFTMTRAGEVYTWTLDLRPAGGTDAQWATVFSGHIDRTGATGPEQGTGAFTVDLDALHQVVPAETSQGKIDATFALSATKRVLDVSVANVVWDPDSDGDGLGHVAPVNASYHYVREPGVGGSLSMTDAMVFLCPANPALAASDVTLASRWYRAGDGAVHGRSDAKATGGQIPAGEAILGVTCHQGATDATAAEGYWMMKLEDAKNVTVQSWGPVGSTTACDPVFGAVPFPDKAGQDFDFTAPVTFPGEF
jgi:hypothetical protein